MADTVTMPKLGFDMAEGTLVRWVIQEGEMVSKGAVLAEIETDKATVEVESTHEGVMAQHLVTAGAVVPVNTPIAVIAAPGEKIEPSAEPVYAAPADAGEVSPPAQPADAPSQVKPEPEPAPEGSRLPDGARASPLARRIAQDMRINLTEVAGSGPGGRVTKRDLQEYLTAPAQASLTSKAATEPSLPAASSPLSPAPEDQLLPLNRLRAAIGRRMTEAKQQTPHFYITHEYKMDRLMALRKQVNELLPEEEKLSVNDFIIKASALALRQFPNLNASYKGNEVLIHGAINIGVAVAVEGGLLTVVSREADQKPLRQIGAEVRSMAERARAGRVKPEDIEGSTFSISNLGMFDVENFAAIINPPEAAILAVGSARQIPVIVEGVVTGGWRMKATISVDHRVSDGAEAARFMQALAAYLEEPLRLLL